MRPIILRFGHVLRFHFGFSISTILFPFIPSVSPFLFPVSPFLFPVSLSLGRMNSRGFRDIVEGDGLHGEAENGLLHGSPGMRGAYASQGSQGRTVHVGTRDRLDALVVGPIPRSVYSKRREKPHLLPRDMCNDRNSRDPRGDAPPRPAHTATRRSPRPTHHPFLSLSPPTRLEKLAKSIHCGICTPFVSFVWFPLPLSYCRRCMRIISTGGSSLIVVSTSASHLRLHLERKNRGLGR